jgi:hypothetical protein
VAKARGAYLMRSYQVVVDLLEPRLQEQPELPGGQRVLAQALARLNREPAAIERLRRAARQETGDWLANASLASLLLRPSAPVSKWPPAAGGSSAPVSAAADAVGCLEAAIAAAPERAHPPLRELLGAARWRDGQELLRAGEAAAAARQFAAAAQEFTAAAAASAVACRALPDRQAAVYVGQAISLLLADQPEAAQRLFSRLCIPGTGAQDPVARFAAGLYELCDALAGLPAADRAAAAETLRAVVLDTRLEVGFYDGRQAVSLVWLSGIG